MELDNVFYIVITIVIFVVSLLGQSKKKKLKNAEVNNDVVYSLNDFEKILLRKEEFRNTESTIGLLEPNETISDKETIVEKIETKNQVHSQNDEKENDDGFDIKSAIVYSSILERKKFRR